MVFYAPFAQKRLPLRTTISFSLTAHSFFESLVFYFQLIKLSTTSSPLIIFSENRAYALNKLKPHSFPQLPHKIQNRIKILFSQGKRIINKRYFFYFAASHSKKHLFLSFIIIQSLKPNMIVVICYLLI